MGAACGKDNGAVSGVGKPAEDLSTVMFRRVDHGNKGFLDIKDLKNMMNDSKEHFQGKDAQHILTKYGTNDKMSPAEFNSWWNSTYTTYNDDAMISDLVDQVKAENSMDPIPETDKSYPEPTKTFSSGEVPINRS